MLEKLEAVAVRYDELQRSLQEPEVFMDPAAYQRQAKELRELAPVAETWRRYRSRVRDAEEALALMEDPEMRELAREEREAALKDVRALEQELKILLLPKDPNDGRNVILEIRAGAGGEEAALFAQSLYRMYCMYAERRGWRVEIANLNDTELGGIREVSCVVEGEDAWSRLKYESGVHRVQRVPETETAGRIHTSTCTVAVLPELDEVEFHLDPADLQIDTFRSSGAGGQKVNKTSSAIRVTHLPTGMVVECQDERSQYKNKDRALKILASRLYEIEQRRQNDAVAAERKSQVGTGDRSERIRTYNFPQGRVTDHRIGLTLHRIDAVLDGDLDPIIDPLITADQAERLQAAEAQQED